VHFVAVRTDYVASFPNGKITTLALKRLFWEALAKYQFIKDQSGVQYPVNEQPVGQPPILEIAVSALWTIWIHGESAVILD
jgi:hypothetical protein